MGIGWGIEPSVIFYMTNSGCTKWYNGKTFMYHYDALGPEKFQEFCQSLIVASFPTAQCLPVAQADGGRDAFVSNRHLYGQRALTSGNELIIFQVKYIRKPSDSRSERELIEQFVSSEKNKLNRYKSFRSLKYILITNLKGTSHPDSGSIDTLNKVLTDALEIESYCWWRDDLDRRLDNAPAVKWSYPELLKATDLLEGLVKGHLGEHEERRRSAVTAYITSQYDDDKELKFKQTDLKSSMIGLFVDLPMRVNIPEYFKYEGMPFKHVKARRNSARWSENWIHRNLFLHGHENAPLSANYFLTTSNSELPDRIILEGAPGQGKSTVTQFICQVLRIQLLGKMESEVGLSNRYTPTQARIPFRVDLRDLAKWVSGIDPFQPGDRPLASTEPKSLEGFIAAQVRAHSGGHSFDVSDLTAIAKASHLLLALDGFDEVADISSRKSLVSEITKGSS